jgi:capsular polysaccharide biosynthesis protein
VVRPATPPKKPVKPNPLLLLLGGLLGGAALALLAATAADLRKGKIIESWQAPRLLGLPLLGEVRAP